MIVADIFVPPLTSLGSRPPRYVRSPNKAQLLMAFATFNISGRKVWEGVLRHLDTISPIGVPAPDLWIFDIHGAMCYDGIIKNQTEVATMKDKLIRTIKSGGRSYDVTITCNGMTPEQAQDDAMNYYIWKLQRVIRDATDKQRAEWEKAGIIVHYTEVGKKVETVEQTIDKFSDDQAKAAYEMLKAKFGK